MNNQRGFSLLEIAVVLVIIGSIVALAAPRLLDRQADTRKVLRDFIIAGRDLKSRAKLGNVTYRIAVDFNEKEQTWWVEKASKPILLDKAEIERQQKDSSSGASDEAPPPPVFQADTSIFKKKQVLPDGYKFRQIESGTLDIIVTEGMGYIHFFPQGLIETSALQIEDPKANIWTVVYNPLTGKADVIPEAKTLKDLAR
ncbi:type II secretion system protein [Pseudobdellovibrio exovorus]|uniref:General secretion pathway protein H n=1 Tax=Pseudobdellovibrio exovorus JSS TaxID=1184267 RepID=M4VCH8_9BACT|nr:type II secretion system protein [Pseudobdellovibrio exovorus]AGH95741.1 hypothetical protein A11Q_1525 [Pseudobdellovibrio exovorus JSS]